jgi:hypothetical protein
MIVMTLTILLSDVGHVVGFQISRFAAGTTVVSPSGLIHCLIRMPVGANTNNVQPQGKNHLGEV